MVKSAGVCSKSPSMYTLPRNNCYKQETLCHWLSQERPTSSRGPGNVPEKGWLLGYHWKNERSEKMKPLFLALDGRYYSGDHISVWRGGETTRKEKKRPKRWALPQQRGKPSELSCATKSSSPAADTVKKKSFASK